MSANRHSAGFIRMFELAVATTGRPDFVPAFIACQPQRFTDLRGQPLVPSFTVLHLTVMPFVTICQLDLRLGIRLRRVLKLKLSVLHLPYPITNGFATC